MPLPIESQESAQGTAPSLSCKAMVRSRGEGQVARVTLPAVAQPQSRRLNPMLRLFAHFALTLAFVEATDPQIVNGPSTWVVVTVSNDHAVGEGGGSQHNKDLSCLLQGVG